MGCGIEHLSNCHGELTGAVFFATAIALWFRTSFVTLRFRVKNWWAEKKVQAAKDKEFP